MWIENKTITRQKPNPKNLKFKTRMNPQLKDSKPWIKDPWTMTNWVGEADQLVGSLSPILQPSFYQENVSSVLQGLIQNQQYYTLGIWLICIRGVTSKYPADLSSNLINFSDRQFTCRFPNRLIIFKLSFLNYLFPGTMFQDFSFTIYEVSRRR